MAKNRKRNWTPQNRVAQITRDKVDEKNRTFEICVSSEYPVDRGFYVEVLSHNEKDVDLSRMNDSHPFLVNHNPNDQVGVIVPGSAKIDGDRKLRATVRMGNSERANEIFRDILDGIRVHISVGYECREINVTRAEDGRDLVTFAWTPHEASTVPIPADPTVGVGRSKERASIERELGAALAKLRNEVFDLIEQYEEVFNTDIEGDKEEENHAKSEGDTQEGDEAKKPDEESKDGDTEGRSDEGADGEDEVAEDEGESEEDDDRASGEQPACPDCGTKRVAGEASCLHCGHSFAPGNKDGDEIHSKTCKHCGRAMVNATACSYCGAKTERGPASGSEAK